MVFRIKFWECSLSGFENFKNLNFLTGGTGRGGGEKGFRSLRLRSHVSRHLEQEQRHHSELSLLGVGRVQGASRGSSTLGSSGLHRLQQLHAWTSTTQCPLSSVSEQIVRPVIRDRVRAQGSENGNHSNKEGAQRGTVADEP